MKKGKSSQGAPKGGAAILRSRQVFLETATDEKKKKRESHYDPKPPVSERKKRD